MIKQSLTLAKRKATESKKIKFKINCDREREDTFYSIEWVIVTIQGTKEQETEEYNDTMKMYDVLGNVFKKREIPKDKNIAKRLKSNKILSQIKIDEAYKAGHGATADKSISSKLLELGIMTHVELEPDWKERAIEYISDF